MKRCLYCGGSFESTSKLKMYCTTSHQKMRWKQKNPGLKLSGLKAHEKREKEKKEEREQKRWLNTTLNSSYKAMIQIILPQPNIKGCLNCGNKIVNEYCSIQCGNIIYNQRMLVKNRIVCDRLRPKGHSALKVVQEVLTTHKLNT